MEPLTALVLVVIASLITLISAIMAYLKQPDIEGLPPKERPDESAHTKIPVARITKPSYPRLTRRDNTRQEVIIPPSDSNRDLYFSSNGFYLPEVPHLSRPIEK